MLVAPAGYGKTTLAREWLENRRHAWYQGGPASADVAALAVGLAEACGTIVPHAGERMRSRLRATNSPEQDVEPLADLLASDLTAWPDDAWIAIDDYQFMMTSRAAEHFVDLLTIRSPVRILLTSRSRPAWATARRLLYGELHELSRTTLAMDQEEASEVLTQGPGEATGLLALADGWPAVIGLASLSPAAIVPDEVPEALYDFFAQELYQALEPQVRSALCRLAAAPTVTAAIARELLGPGALSILRQGEQIGVLTYADRETYLMHPLLRAFLLERLAEHGFALHELARRLYSHYAAHADWDAAFSVLELSHKSELLPQLIKEALPSLLAEGRLPTLHRWLAYAESSKVQAPILDLAMAEAALRQGDAARAETIAEHTLRALPVGDSLRPRLLLLAGKAASLGHRTERALAYLQRARGEMLSDDEAYEALWGQFIAAARLETPQAEELLEQLGLLANAIPERELRRVSALQILGTRMGTIRELDQSFKAVLHLVPRTADPFIRSTFTFSQATLLTLSAHYRHAMHVLEGMLTEVRGYRLDFALPHAYTLKALVHLGLREFRQAATLIGFAERMGVERTDIYVQMNCAALQARLLLYQGETEQAIRTLNRPWDSLPERSMHAEYLAMRALALSCRGEAKAAIDQSDEAAARSLGIEAGVLGRCAVAIAQLDLDPKSSEAAVAHAFDHSLSVGNLDGLLLACRISPSFLTALAGDEHRRDSMGNIVRNAQDYVLARRLKVTLPPRATAECLTPREKEVYELLALGRTNREIASALFISEQTAKVHTLRILAKLGLRSRTEVALHATAQQPT